MPIIPIDDVADVRIAPYRNVSDHELLTRHRLFVAEGRLVVRRLLETKRLRTQSLMITRPALVTLKGLLDTRDELPVYLVPQEVMNGITGFNMHRGCLALGERPAACSWRELADQAHLLVALERLSNADNVGSIVRSASAFGVDGVLLESSCTDPLYRKAIRTSMGAALTMPHARAEPWPDVLRQLAQQGWTVVATTPAPDAPPLRDVARECAGKRVAVLLGHEGDGVSPDARRACSHSARIPMSGGVDSLNVATAAAIALYEIAQASGIRPQGWARSEASDGPEA